ncbi:aminotransferase class IV [Nafulsella turpanensis]|uniref:aminotransferase class IV n=1 Tax=Nafulsella turpanensis TaxID=1265690 RepID=UPI00034C1367|nr:aminotransferase class IV [Nafulsella turpanensis]
MNSTSSPTPLSGHYFFINNRIVSSTEEALQLSDLGLFRGYGIFDYFRTHEGKPFLMRQYLQRFRRSGKDLRLELNLSDEELEATILELIKLNGRSESGVRLLLTGGYSENTFTPSTPNLIIRIEKSVLPDERSYTEGVKLISTEYLRDMPEVKTTNYLKAVREWPAVEAAGATELLYHWNGEWLECSRSNFFVVVKGVLITAPLPKVLAGVTRGETLRIARESGIPVKEESLPLAILPEAEEAFITGTTKRIMPVVQVDGQQIGNGKPGPVSKRLLQEWQLLETRNSREY